MAPPSNPLPERLRTALARGATVILPHESAAAALRARFDAVAQADGRGAWHAPMIVSWNAWMSQLWNGLVTNGVEQRTLLNEAQEHLLWREVIAAAPEAGPLLSRDALATMASRAWKLACSYEVEGELRRAAATHDAKIFANWAVAFAKECQHRQCVSAGTVPVAMRRHVESGSMSAPEAVCLVGFDDDTPARARLLAAMEARGAAVERMELAAEPGERMVVACTDLREEMRAAAGWIRKLLERVGAPKRVALVVPGLAEERATVEPILREVLAPELQQVDTELAAAPYAFSTGRSLAESSLVATALEVVRWCGGELPVARVTRLLLSPYLGRMETLAGRAAFDAHVLRRVMLPRPELSAERVHTLARDAAEVGALCGPVARHAASFSGQRAGYAEWMERFTKLLNDAGFPGEQALTTQESADLKAWERACDMVATLDFAGQRVSLAEALQALEHECRQAVPRGSELAPVQVMTPSEAMGGIFDAMVFVRATDANWPATEKANPLLSWALQQSHGMPGTNAAQASDRGERATARLANGAEDVVFFYAKNAEDEAGPQRLSPAIERLGWRGVDAAEVLGTNQSTAPIQLDRVNDLAPLPPPASHVRGGAVVLKLQAACGFRAFAELRLQAAAIEDAAAGFDHREAGNMLHDTMEKFWEQVGSQDSLRQMPEAERTAKLRSAVERALMHVQTDGPWDKAYLDVQKQRLRTLVTQWLEAELDREPFRVLGREEAREVTVGPLTLKLRLDRIDEVEGGTLLVDYKTGQQLSHKDWAGERPDEPQLPLYSLLPEADRLKGVTFARIRAGEMKWVGMAEDGLLPGKSRLEFATMQEQVEAWRWVLERLAQQFAEGRTGVEPKVFDQTCRHCQQRILCRVDGMALMEVDEGAEAGDGE